MVLNKEYDPGLQTLEETSELTNDDRISDKDLLNKILKYLESGILLCSAMSFIYDFDGKPIGNLDYYTDGIYVWPSYFPYFIKNKFEKIDCHFIDYLVEKKFQIETISKENLILIEKVFIPLWQGKKSRIE